MVPGERPHQRALASEVKAERRGCEIAVAGRLAHTGDLRLGEDALLHQPLPEVGHPLQT